MSADLATLRAEIGNLEAATREAAERLADVDSDERRFEAEGDVEALARVPARRRIARNALAAAEARYRERLPAFTAADRDRRASDLAARLEVLRVEADSKGVEIVAALATVGALVAEREAVLAAIEGQAPEADALRVSLGRPASTVSVVRDALADRRTLSLPVPLPR